MKHKLELLIVVFLIGGNFVIGYTLRESILDIMFLGDDPIYIMVANNFREDKSFTRDYLGEYVFWEESYDNIIKKYPASITTPDPGKGPTYIILVGSVFELLDTSQKDLQLHASVFNNCISSLFVILFFFLTRRYFGLKIAFLSSVMVLFLPYFEFYSVFVRPHMLMYTFSLCAFFFLQKNKLHYAMFGLFVGLAHLTHPFGIILGFSYIVFLLLNREVRGMMIAFIAWQLTLLPLLIKNYIDFGDIGIGLYLPFSHMLSPIISLIVHRDGNIILHPGSVITERLTEQGKTELFDVLYSGTVKFSVNFTMDAILAFIIVFSMLYFFKIERLMTKEGRTCLLCAALVAIMLVVFAHFVGFFVQLAVVFAVPLLFFYFIKKARENYFSTVPRYSFFVILFAFVNLGAYYFTSVLLNFSTPDPYQLMLPLFLMIPLAIAGLDNVVGNIKLKIKSRIPKTAVLFLILLPILAESYYGIDFNNYAPEYSHEGHDVISVDSWVGNNSDNIRNIASNNPLHTSYKTNIKAVAIPESYTPDFEKYLSHFDVSHLVFYGLTVENLQKNYSSILNTTSTFPYVYEPVFTAANSTVISRAISNGK